MARAVKQDKQTRNRYSDEYKSEALALAARMGVASAAKQLGLNESQLYAWRGKARRDQTQGESERQLSVENVRLKRQLADQCRKASLPSISPVRECLFLLRNSRSPSTRQRAATMLHCGHALWELVCPGSTLNKRVFQQLFAHAAAKLHPT